MTAVSEDDEGRGRRVAYVTRAASGLSAIQGRLPVIQWLGIVACVAFASLEVDGFTSKANLLAMAVFSSFLALSVAGETLVVMLGGIDLSIGGMIAFGAVLIPYYASHWHAPFLLVAAGAVAFCGMIGTAGGWICYRRAVNPLILTLAVGACMSGWVLVATRNAGASPSPAWLSTASLPYSRTLGIGIPPIVSACIVLVALSVVVLSRTTFGRRLYATGANPRAAQLALLAPDRVWMVSFGLSAALAATAGLFIGGFSGNGDSTVGDPYVFQGIAAIVVGGTLLGSGRGDFLRTATGAVFLTVLSTALVSLGFGAADTEIVTGLLILVVVAGVSRERSAQSRV